MFCGLRFKFVFYQILWPFWSHLGLHSASFFRKEPFRKSLQESWPSAWKWVIIPVSDGSWRRRLACALLEQKQLLELEFKFDFSSSSNCGSNSCPSLSWLEFEIEKLLENGCLSWLRLQKFRKQFEKWKGLISKLNAHDLTRRLGQGPANFIN